MEKNNFFEKPDLTYLILSYAIKKETGIHTLFVKLELKPFRIVKMVQEQ